MSRLIDSGILSQLKKAQGETNERLDQLIGEQMRVTDLLERLVALLEKPAT